MSPSPVDQERNDPASTPTAPVRTERPIRRSLELTPRGRIALILLHLTAGAALLTGDDNARLAAAMIASPLLIDLLVKLVRVPRLHFEVPERRTHARASFLESVQIANAGHATLRDLTLREPKLTVHTAGPGHVPHLPAGRGLACRMVLRSKSRGIAMQRSLRVETGWPLGFLRWTIQLTIPRRIVTEPARAELPADLARALAEATTRPDAGRLGEEQEFHSLREYRYGEDARSVHARRSASLGTLVRRVLRGLPEPDVSLVLDLRRPPGMPNNYGARDLDLHLGRAARLLDVTLARGATLHCAIIDDTLWTASLDTPRTARAALDRLAVARTVEHRPLTDAEIERLSSASLTVWIPGGGHVEHHPDLQTGIRLIQQGEPTGEVAS